MFNGGISILIFKNGLSNINNVARELKNCSWIDCFFFLEVLQVKFLSLDVKEVKALHIASHDEKALVQTILCEHRAEGGMPR
jgi:hypothetical protein